MKNKKNGVTMSIVLVLSGTIMLLLVLAILLQLGIVNPTQEQINLFRENYGEDACWILGGTMLLLIVLAFYETSKTK